MVPGSIILSIPSCPDPKSESKSNPAVAAVAAGGIIRDISTVDGATAEVEAGAATGAAGG